MASAGNKAGSSAASASAAQVQFDSRVEAHAQKMMVNYRTLLKKFALLSSQEGFGRHEKLQIETCSEVIVSRAPFGTQRVKIEAIFIWLLLAISPYNYPLSPLSWSWHSGSSCRAVAGHDPRAANLRSAAGQSVGRGEHRIRRQSHSVVNSISHSLSSSNSLPASRLCEFM